jgi:hypothetical protein
VRNETRPHQAEVRDAMSQTSVRVSVDTENRD